MQIALQDLTYAACGLWAVLDQDTEQLGYNWDFCNGNLGQLTIEGRQYCIRITNRGSCNTPGVLNTKTYHIIICIVHHFILVKTLICIH